jgi:hypothetical protein
VLAAVALSAAAGLALMGLGVWWLGRDGRLPAALAGALLSAALFPLLFVFWQLRHTGYGRRTGGRRVLSSSAALAAAAALGVVTVVAVRSAIAANPRWLGTALVVTAAVVLPLVYVIAVLAMSPPDDRLRHFRRTLGRSLVPVLAAALLVLGVLSQAYLRAAEAHSLAPLARPELQYWEADMAGAEAYRSELADLSRQWLAEHGETP